VFLRGIRGISGHAPVREKSSISWPAPVREKCSKTNRVGPEGIRYYFIAFWECKLSSQSGEYNSKQNKMKSPMAKLLTHGALVVALVEELGPSSSSWGPLSWPWSRNLGQGPRPGSPHCGLGRGTWASFETSTTPYKTTKVRQEPTHKIGVCF
jgi:hypothetical protein